MVQGVLFGEKSLVIFLLSLTFALSENKVVVSHYFESPVFTQSKNGEWLLTDYFGTGIRRIDRHGEISQEIEYGMGSGPGEFQNPRFIFEFPDENTIVVIGKHADTHAFDSRTGKFKEKIIRFLPYNQAVKWDERHFLILWGKNVLNAGAKDSFILFDLQGNEIDSWEVPQPQWQQEYIYQKVNGSALDWQKTVYFANMAKPELLVYKYKSPDQSIWRLKPPKGYQPAPTEKLNREEMFNRAKLQTYMDSFSYINTIFTVRKGRYLVVAWINANGKKQTFDLYQIEDRNLLRSNIEVEGHVIGATEEQVITQIFEDLVSDEEPLHSQFGKYSIFN